MKLEDAEDIVFMIDLYIDHRIRVETDAGTDGYRFCGDKEREVLRSAIVHSLLKIATDDEV